MSLQFWLGSHGVDWPDFLEHSHDALQSDCKPAKALSQIDLALPGLADWLQFIMMNQLGMHDRSARQNLQLPAESQHGVAYCLPEQMHLLFA